MDFSQIRKNIKQMKNDNLCSLYNFLIFSFFHTFSIFLILFSYICYNLSTHPLWDKIVIFWAFYLLHGKVSSTSTRPHNDQQTLSFVLVTLRGPGSTSIKSQK